jgi:hypothetical protein
LFRVLFCRACFLRRLAAFLREAPVSSPVRSGERPPPGGQRPSGSAFLAAKLRAPGPVPSFEENLWLVSIIWCSWDDQARTSRDQASGVNPTLLILAADPIAPNCIFDHPLAHPRPLTSLPSFSPSNITNSALTVESPSVQPPHLFAPAVGCCPGVTLRHPGTGTGRATPRVPSYSTPDRPARLWRTAHSDGLRNDNPGRS